MTGRRSRATYRALFVLLTAVTLSAQQTAGTFRVERPIVPTGAGPQRLAIDVPLLARSQRFTRIRSGARSPARAEGGLADLRIFDAQGQEVPYLLVHPARDPEWLAAATLPVAVTKKTSGFEADLREARVVDMLLVEGLPAPFLKRLMLEGSGDREHWTLLAGEGTLFDLPEQRLQQLSVSFTAGTYRYLRITWDDASSGRMPLPERVSARAVPDDTVGHRLLTAAVMVERRPSEPGRSRYRLKLPAAGLPIVGITLDVGSGHVFRPAAVTESRFDQAQASPTLLGRETLARIERDGITVAALRIPIAPPREAELELIVEDGDNPPLDLKGISIELAQLPWIYFEGRGRPLRARYGNASLTPPVYDLEAVRTGLKLTTVPEARWGEALEAEETIPPPPAAPGTGPGAAIDTAGFRHRRSIPAGSPGLAVLPLDVAALAHSDGPGSAFADVRISDESGKQVPYLLERRDEPLVVPLTLQTTSSRANVLRSEPGHTRSVYGITLPYPRLPSARLVLETSDRVFRRDVQVVAERPSDRAHRDTSVEVLASGRWWHAVQDVPTPALLLPLPPTEETHLLVVVDEGDNRPLTISRTQLLLPSWRLRFFAPSGPLSLLYGHDQLRPPRYDLALLAPQVMGAEAREVEAMAEASAAVADQQSIIAPRTFWIGLSIAVLILLAIIGKLLSGSSAGQPPPSPPAP